MRRLACLALLLCACQRRHMEPCKYDFNQCHLPPLHASDMPPIGVLGLEYQGCMVGARLLDISAEACAAVAEAGGNAHPSWSEPEVATDEP